MTHWRGTPAQLVFADAPYQSGAGIIAVLALARIGALTNGTVIVLETAKNETLDVKNDVSSNFSIVEERIYGKAMLHFLIYQT